jgi:hypothetical protein
VNAAYMIISGNEDDVQLAHEALKEAQKAGKLAEDLVLVPGTVREGEGSFVGNLHQSSLYVLLPAKAKWSPDAGDMTPRDVEIESVVLNDKLVRVFLDDDDLLKLHQAYHDCDENAQLRLSGKAMRLFENQVHDIVDQLQPKAAARGSRR